jgi:hypothetical protein
MTALIVLFIAPTWAGMRSPAAAAKPLARIDLSLPVAVAGQQKLA